MTIWFSAIKFEPPAVHLNISRSECEKLGRAKFAKSLKFKKPRLVPPCDFKFGFISNIAKECPKKHLWKFLDLEAYTPKLKGSLDVTFFSVCPYVCPSLCPKIELWDASYCLIDHLWGPSEPEVNCGSGSELECEGRNFNDTCHALNF